MKLETKYTYPLNVYKLVDNTKTLLSDLQLSEKVIQPN